MSRLFIEPRMLTKSKYVEGFAFDSRMELVPEFSTLQPRGGSPNRMKMYKEEASK
jgi:hypothetical protein